MFSAVGSSVVCDCGTCFVTYIVRLIGQFGKLVDLEVDLHPIISN